MARVTGLEPATSGVTGRHSNQLSYTRAFFKATFRKPCTGVSARRVRSFKWFAGKCQATAMKKR